MPLAVISWREVEVNGERQWGWFPLDAIDISSGTFVGDKPHYVGDDFPDVAFLLTHMRATPSVVFADAPVEIGEPLAFSGYPMGLRTLLGHQGFRQESPTLHAGVAAAIHPNRIAETPYGFLIHANTQGGASGSPVFREDGSVVGMVYMGIPEIYAFRDPANPNAPGVTYKVPTALTGCISSVRISESARLADASAAAHTDRPRYDEQIRQPVVHHPAPDEPVMEPFPTEGDD